MPTQCTSAYSPNVHHYNIVQRLLKLLHLSIVRRNEENHSYSRITLFRIDTSIVGLLPSHFKEITLARDTSAKKNK